MANISNFYISKLLLLIVRSYFANRISFQNQSSQKSFTKLERDFSETWQLLKAWYGLSEDTAGVPAVTAGTSNYEWRPFWLHWQDEQKQVKRIADGIQIKILEWHFNSNWNTLFWQEQRILFSRNVWGQWKLQYGAS